MGPRVWQRLFGFPPWGMWLGCPAILHASLRGHGLQQKMRAFLHRPALLHLSPFTNVQAEGPSCRVTCSWWCGSEVVALGLDSPRDTPPSITLSRPGC